MLKNLALTSHDRRQEIRCSGWMHGELHMGPCQLRGTQSNTLWIYVFLEAWWAPYGPMLATATSRCDNERGNFLNWDQWRLKGSTHQQREREVLLHSGYVFFQKESIIKELMRYIYRNKMSKCPGYLSFISLFQAWDAHPLLKTCNDGPDFVEWLSTTSHCHTRAISTREIRTGNR